MSAGYGYFRIEFYTSDGSADADAAKRAYDWCKENYGWFRGEEGDGSDAPFLLNKNKFVPNEDAYPDGLDIKYGDVPDNTAWLQKPFKAVKAARLVASIHQDYSETSYGSNSYHEGVWERGRSFCFYELPRFNTSMHPAYIEIGPGRGIHISDGPYGFTYRQIRGLFKNAKTGEEILCGEVRHNEDKRNDRGELSGTLRIGEASFPVLVGDDDVSFEDGADEDKIVSAFVSALKKVAGYKEAVQDEWTFEDFGTQRTLFDLYGSNPPIPQYTTLSVNSDGSADIHKGEAVPQMKEDEADNPLEDDEWQEPVVLVGDGVVLMCSDKSVTSVEILAGVTEIGYMAFTECTSLASVVIPAGVKKIGVFAFKGCKALASVVIPDSVTEIYSGAFEGCTSLASVVIPEGVTKIGDEAFYGCTALASVEIPEGVTEICSYTFNGCKSLASVEIPDSVTGIGLRAFEGCTELSSVEFGGTMAQWDAVKGKKYLFNGDVPATGVKCADGVWQKPVVLVKDGVAEGCLDKSAASVEIPAGVKIIGLEAFKGCKSLAAVVIPAGVTAIGDVAFYGCTALASVEIPAGVTAIGYEAFYGCTALASVEFGGTMAQWDAVNGKKYLFNGDVPATSVKCADGVWQPLLLIEGGVAEKCLDKSAASVEIPAGVTEIGRGVFKGCTALKTVVLADGLAKVKSDWFKDLPSDYEIVCTEGSAAFKSVKRSPKLKAHIKAKL